MVRYRSVCFVSGSGKPHSVRFPDAAHKKSIRSGQVRMPSQKNWRVNPGIDPPCDFFSEDANNPALAELPPAPPARIERFVCVSFHNAINLHRHSAKVNPVSQLFPHFPDGGGVFLSVSPSPQTEKTSASLTSRTLSAILMPVISPAGHTVPETHPDRMPHNNEKGMK